MNITPAPADLTVAVPSPAVPMQISLVPNSNAVTKDESSTDGVSSDSSLSQTQKSYPIRFKRACVKTINGLHAVSKLSVKAACAQVGISPLSYHCWKKQVQKLETLQNNQDIVNGNGVEVIHIPAGCTYLCQPVDVGINRPIKQKMAQLWEDWMIDEGAATNKTPHRKLIAEWIMITFRTTLVKLADDYEGSLLASKRSMGALENIEERLPSMCGKLLHTVKSFTFLTKKCKMAALICLR